MGIACRTVCWMLQRPFRPEAGPQLRLCDLTEKEPVLQDLSKQGALCLLPLSRSTAGALTRDCPSAPVHGDARQRSTCLLTGHHCALQPVADCQLRWEQATGVACSISALIACCSTFTFWGCAGAATSGWAVLSCCSRARYMRVAGRCCYRSFAFGLVRATALGACHCSPNLPNLRDRLHC